MLVMYEALHWRTEELLIGEVVPDEHRCWALLVDTRRSW